MTALDFSKPQFDLVQPRGISGRVMERNFGGDQRETVRLLESLCAERLLQMTWTSLPLD